MPSLVVMPTSPFSFSTISMSIALLSVLRFFKKSKNLFHFTTFFDFIGKESLINSTSNQKKQFAMFILENSKPGKPLILHDEPIYYDGKIIGETTSGNFSFCYDVNMAFGYINNISKDECKNIEVEVEKIKYKAILETKPLHDSENKNIKL